ncbi:MAG TPA: LysR substrate-binding domain-containing protein [Terriglobia bacterium]|jgi:LysR family hydrogen peroxide-inducible transcriptional activator
MPSLAQLEYIVAVADLKHFGKAAEACHISQPTLSQQIRKVEEDLDIVIFDRVKKPIVLTEDGEAILQQARRILREHRRLQEIARQKSDEISGEFRLGVIPTVANTLVPHFVKRFAEQYPKVTLLIDELKTSSILQELSEDRLDAGVMATPLSVAGLLEEPLYYETFNVYAATDHRLLKGKTCRIDDLDLSDMWLLQDGHCFKDQVMQLCSLGESKTPTTLPRIQFQGGNLDTLLRLVRQGTGYTLLPAFMIDQMPVDEVKTHVREFQRPFPAREISLVSRRAHWRRKTIIALRESILANPPQCLYMKRRPELRVLDVCLR